MDEFELGFIKLFKVDHQSFVERVLDFSLSANLSQYGFLELRIIVITLFRYFLIFFQWESE